MKPKIFSRNTFSLWYTAVQKQCSWSTLFRLLFKGKADFIQLVANLKAENQHSIQEHSSIYSAHRKIYDFFAAFFLPSNTKTCIDVGDSQESKQIAIPCNREMLSCSQYPLISESHAVSVVTNYVFRVEKNVWRLLLLFIGHQHLSSHLFSAMASYCRHSASVLLTRCSLHKAAS